MDMNPKMDLKYACGCELPATQGDEKLHARLCGQHASNLLSILSMNGQYVANHNSRGERSIVTWEPIAQETGR